MYSSMDYPHKLMCGLTKRKYTLLYPIALFTLVLLYKPYPLVHDVFAAPPNFSIQEMKVKPHDWIDMLKKKHTNQGDNYTDISTITYFSDGRILNVTL